MVYETEEQAVRAWVSEMNAIPTSVIEKLLDAGEEISEITPYKDGEEPYAFLPVWGWMWTFGDGIDEEWATGEYLGPHIQEMADCGFRLYQSEDFRLIFGIDGAGYDFYEAHWIPLYRARGLKWHKEVEESEDHAETHQTV